MEQIKIAICEDDKEEQEKLTSILDKSDIPLTYTLFYNAEELLKIYKADDYDLIFMDIYMAEITGVVATKKIRAIDQDVYIAFTTTSTEHTTESYRIKANNYIEKPLDIERVFEVLETVQTNKENAPKLRIKINGKDVSLPFRDVMYIEQDAHRLSIFCEDKKPVCARYSLDDIEVQLDKVTFFRCHTSFLVNLRWVKKIDREMMAFVMKDGSLAYIRREDIGKAQKAFSSFIISKQIKWEELISEPQNFPQTAKS